MIFILNSLFTKAEKKTILKATYEAMENEARATSKRALELRKECTDLFENITTPIKTKKK